MNEQSEKDEEYEDKGSKDSRVQGSFLYNSYTFHSIPRILEFLNPFLIILKPSHVVNISKGDDNSPHEFVKYVLVTQTAFLDVFPYACAKGDLQGFEDPEADEHGGHIGLT